MARNGRLVALVLIVGAGLIVGCGGGETSSTPSASRVVAEVGSGEITSDQLLERIQRDQFDLVRNTLEILISEELLEREAEARGTTVEELVTTEVTGKISEPTPQEAEAFYRERQAQMGGQTFAQVGPQIAEYLLRGRVAQRQGEFIAELRAARGSRVLIEAPRFDVTVAENIPAKGPADAPVTIVEFADFECPACRSAQPPLQRVLLEYGDRVRFVYRDFPLPNHPRAIPAAEAAYCANDQGKFWDYHESLMGGGALQDADLLDQARAMGLDMTQFQECTDSSRHSDIVRQAFDQGRELGVDSTPTMFINGRRVVGAQSYEVLRQIVEEELARSAG